MTSVRAWAWKRSAAHAVTVAASCLFLASAASALELNTANRAQLEQLSGIGVIAAERILTERDKGEFKSWDDFMRRVKGFKKASSAKLSDAGLTVGGAACAASCGARPATVPTPTPTLDDTSGAAAPKTP